MSPHLAARWPQACSQLLPSQPFSVRQANGSKRATQGGFRASLVLGGLDEATEFIVHDIGCGVDVLLGYNWLAAHDLHFPYE